MVVGHQCKLAVKESGLERTWVDSVLHHTSQWGQQMLLSEHVCCVAVTFKMTEPVEHQVLC